MTTKRTDLDRIVQEEFLTTGQANRLKAAGIKDGPALVEMWRTPAERLRLAQAAGLSVSRLMRAVFAANLLQQSPPGRAGIDILLQHKEEAIREFEDTEDDHKLVCGDRQGVLAYAGEKIHENWSKSIEYGSRPIVRFFAWFLGLALLFDLGISLYAHWRAISGRFGPDVTSQLAQALGRREALAWSVMILLLVGLEGLVFILSSAWMMGPVNARLNDRLDAWLGRTPRDILVWLEAQECIPPAWAKTDRLLNFGAIFIWAIPIIAGSLLPGLRGSASLFSFGLLGAWIFLKIKLFNKAFDQMPAEWAQQARARQAGWMLCRMVVIILLILILYGIWFAAFWLLALGAGAWMQAQAQAANTGFQAWVMQQPLAGVNPANLNQFILETTQTWVESGRIMIDWLVGWLPVALQMVSAGLLGLAAGCAFGGYFFVHRKGWMKALWIVTAIYLVFEILPILTAWWLRQDFQSRHGWPSNLPVLLLELWQAITQSGFGLAIGLFLTLGKTVFDESRDRYLDHECPECHRLLIKPGCACGCQSGFEQVPEL